MWKDVNLLCLPPVRNQFVFYEFAAGEKARHATLVCSEPFVNVCLCRQDERGTASSRIAAFGCHVPKFPSAAFFAAQRIVKRFDCDWRIISTFATKSSSELGS